MLAFEEAVCENLGFSLAFSDEPSKYKGPEPLYRQNLLIEVFA